jgi:hypothetical protein
MANWPSAAFDTPAHKLQRMNSTTQSPGITAGAHPAYGLIFAMTAPALTSLPLARHRWPAR